MPIVDALSHARAARSVEAIRRASYESGVDFNYLLQQARLESGLNPDAAARTSSATGLYQFIEQTWLGTVQRHGAAHGLGWAAAIIRRGSNGRLTVDDPAMRRHILDLRRNPEIAAGMAASLASDNRVALQRHVSRPIENVDMYLAHFLGSGGATRFLTEHARNPDAAGAQLFPAAARANRSIFFANGRMRSLDDIRNIFARRMNAAGGQPTPAAPAWFNQPDPAPGTVTPPTSPEMASATPQQARQAQILASIAHMTLAQLGG